MNPFEWAEGGHILAIQGSQPVVIRMIGA